MPIHVAFQVPSWAGSTASPAFGTPRASEAIADAGTGSLTAQDGEIAVVTNTGDAVAYVAHGSTPDSSATTATAATSARYAMGAGQTLPVQTRTGDKFATAAS